MFRPKILLKQMSWSPETDHHEIWQRRKTLSTDRQHRRSLSITDEDIDELRGFLDLGIVFDDGCPNDRDCSNRISEALPALNLYLAVRRSFRGSIGSGKSPLKDSISSSGGNPLSILPISSGESQEARQAGIKRWARLVALAARDCC